MLSNTLRGLCAQIRLFNEQGFGRLFRRDGRDSSSIFSRAKRSGDAFGKANHRAQNAYEAVTISPPVHASGFCSTERKTIRTARVARKAVSSALEISVSPYLLQRCLSLFK